MPGKPWGLDLAILARRARWGNYKRQTGTAMAGPSTTAAAPPLAEAIDSALLEDIPTMYIVECGEAVRWITVPGALLKRFAEISAQTPALSDAAMSTNGRSDASATTVLRCIAICAFPLCRDASATTPCAKCASEESRMPIVSELLSAAEASTAPP